MSLPPSTSAARITCRSRARRRHLAGGAIDRAGRHPRFFQVLQSHPRNQRGRQVGARRAGLRARRSQSARQAARLAIRARHLDRQPRHHRRHGRQQFLRHAFDHPRQNHRSRAGVESPSDGRQRHPRAAIDEAELDAKVPAARSPRRELSHGTASSRRCHADEIERRFPKILRRVGGYNLDAFVAGTRRPVSPRSSSCVSICPSLRRLRRHARHRPRSEAAARRVAQGQGAARRAVRRLARRARGDADHPDASAGRGRGHGSVHSRLHEAERGRVAAARFHPGRSGGDSDHRVLWRHGERIVAET